MLNHLRMTHGLKKDTEGLPYLQKSCKYLHHEKFQKDDKHLHVFHIQIPETKCALCKKHGIKYMRSHLKSKHGLNTVKERAPFLQKRSKYLCGEKLQKDDGDKKVKDTHLVNSEKKLAAKRQGTLHRKKKYLPIENVLFK